MVKDRMVPRGARTGGRRGGLALLRAERDPALGVVDRHRELVEEVAAEQAVHARLVDVVRDHDQPVDLRGADLDRLDRHGLDLRLARRALHRPPPAPAAPFPAPAAVPRVSEMPAAAMTRGATTVRSAPVSSMRRADVEPFSRASTRMRWPGVNRIVASPAAPGGPPARA